MKGFYWNVVVLAITAGAAHGCGRDENATEEAPNLPVEIGESSSEDASESPSSSTQALTGSDHIPFGAGLGQFAHVVRRDNGDIRIDLAFYSLSTQSPPGICELYDGACLIPGTYVPILQLDIPAGLQIPFGYDTLNDLAGVAITWYHSEMPTDFESYCVKTDMGGWDCPQLWVRQSLTSETADLYVEVAKLQPWPGGQVELAISVPRFAVRSASGRTTFCCGEMRYHAEGELDEYLWLSVDEMTGWSGSVSCGYGSLADVPRAESCPASR